MMLLEGRMLMIERLLGRLGSAYSKRQAKQIGFKR